MRADVYELVAEAVWSGETTEATAEFEYNFEFSESLFAGASAKQLAKYAARLYNVSRGIAKDYESDEDVVAYLVSKGVCGEYTDLSVNATYADVSIMLANALSDNSYTDISVDVVLENSDSSNAGYVEALKLVKAGIMSSDINLSATVTGSELAELIANHIQPDIRETDAKRTIYILGDSLCAGFGPDYGTWLGWPYRLDEYLDGNVNIVNHAVGGINTETYATEDMHQTYTDIFKTLKEGDLVFIALGTNDWTLCKNTPAGLPSMTEEQIIGNYCKFIDEVRLARAIPVLIAPTGRNQVNENGVYVDSAPNIIDWMNACNDTYNKDVLKLHLAGDNGPDFDGSDNLHTVVTPIASGAFDVRNDGHVGMRVTATVSISPRNIVGDVVEYGFIVTRSSLLGSGNLTFTSGVKYVYGVAFNNVAEIDIINSYNESAGTYGIGCVLENIPDNKEALTENMVIRTYLRIGNAVFYGAPVQSNLYEIAKSRIAADLIMNILRI